jgi:hypothetical protein
LEGESFLPLVLKPKNLVVYGSDGDILTKEMLKETAALSWALEKASWKYNSDNSDMSLAKALADYGGWIPATTQAGKVAETTLIDGAIGEKYEDISAYTYHAGKATEKDFGANDFTVNDQRGYASILDNMVEEIEEI